MQYYHILIHHQLLKLLRQRPPEWRDCMQKTLERLQFGYWDNGTRVKLLKGVAKLVFEARVTRDLRLLFTVARGAAATPPYALEPYILAWDLVDHDHLDRARRLNVEPETGFLDFQSIVETELSAAPTTPERAVAEAPADQAGFRAWLSAPAPEPSFDEITESIRWFRLDEEVVVDPADWQALLDDAQVQDLELKLSREQAEAIFAPGPVLLKGTAGSGKTTVSVYRLARALHENPAARVLYVTYSQPLVTSVRQLFHDLYRARRQPLPPRLPDFLTFPQLYRRLVGEPDLSADAAVADLVRFPGFAHWFRGLYRSDDASLAWEEIRGIIKGACLDLHADHLSPAAYEALGRKRAPLFAAQRPQLYKVFEAYARWLGKGPRRDDIDLARRARRALHGRPAPYDLVICDEGQDLTELELHLLLDLCPDLHGLFFAADPQQIVNPSGFRWAELRSLLRDRHAWSANVDIRRLSRNFRSVQSIVSLANACVTLQRERTGRSDDDDLQETTLQGATPVLVRGDSAAVLDGIRDFGPRCAVITRTPEDADALRLQLDTTRVFDIAGAKGLEFEAVLLWQPLAADAELWHRLLDSDVPMKDDPMARRALRHLYVGITRARRYLGLYEPDHATALWTHPAWGGRVEPDQPEALAKFMLKAATPDAWATEGAWFLDRERYLQAAECYRRAGREREASLAVACHHEQLGDHAAAATLYAELGLDERLAPCLEHAGQHGRAAAVYERLGRDADAARNHELANHWQAAADAWHRLNHEDERRRCQREHHVRHRNWPEAAKIALKQGATEDAIAYYRRAGMTQRVAELRRQLAEEAGRFDELAEDHERSGQFATAAGHWDRAGKPDAAGRCRALAAEKAGDHHAAIGHWVDLGELDRAGIARARAAAAEGRHLEAARFFSVSSEHLDEQRRALAASTEPDAARWLAALNHSRARRHADAARIYDELRMVTALRAEVERVLNGIRVHSDRAAAADLVEEMKDLLYRAEIYDADQEGDTQCLVKLGADKEIIRCSTLRILSDILEAHKKYGPAGDVALRIPDYDRAIALYTRARAPKKRLCAEAAKAEAAEDYVHAADLWTQAGKKRDAGRCLQLQEDEDDEDEYEEIQDDLDALNEVLRKTVKPPRPPKPADDPNQDTLPGLFS